MTKIISRILLIYIAIPALLSCKQSVKTKQLKIYNLKVNQLVLNAYGNRYENKIKEDTIMALNDTTAYMNGLIDYYSRLKAEKATNNYVYTTKSFLVEDSVGIDLTYSLNSNVVDSLTKKIKALL